MIDDDLCEDVYDAVNWLRRHGVEVNDNLIKKEKYETSNAQGYRTGKNAIKYAVINSKDIRNN